jgi:transcriptional regulator with PAS, ATPase and Fis domain
VDTEPGKNTSFYEHLSEYFPVILAQSPEECMRIIHEEIPSLVLAQYDLKTINGIQLFRNIQKISPETTKVLIRQRNGILPANSVKYQTVYIENFRTTGFKIVKRCLDELSCNKNQSKSPNNSHRKNLPVLIGSAPFLMEALKWARKISKLSETILITGKSGTGKDVFARYIHLSGNRYNAPFHVVNCAAINPGLFESEFFGHRKGSFTGATECLDGHFKIADRGILVLDEVSEIDLGFQAKLLRAIENQEIIPVGSQKTLKIDTRIIAITNRNLEDLIRIGKFREDLYYRLNVYHLKIPSLRERMEDLESLVRYFVQCFCFKYRSLVKIQIDPHIFLLIEKMPFRGNIRELENLIYKVMSTKNPKENTLTKEDFKIFLNASIRSDQNQLHKNLKEYLYYMEKQKVLEALDKTRQNITRAAAMLGISRQNLQYRLKKLGIIL